MSGRNSLAHLVSIVWMFRDLCLFLYQNMFWVWRFEIVFFWCHYGLLFWFFWWRKLHFFDLLSFSFEKLLWLCVCAFLKFLVWRFSFNYCFLWWFFELTWDGCRFLFLFFSFLEFFKEFFLFFLKWCYKLFSIPLKWSFSFFVFFYFFLKESCPIF